MSRDVALLPLVCYTAGTQMQGGGVGLCMSRCYPLSATRQALTAGFTASFVSGASAALLWPSLDVMVHRVSKIRSMVSSVALTRRNMRLAPSTSYHIRGSGGFKVK